mgnify:CR=1 FL=1
MGRALDDLHRKDTVMIAGRKNPTAARRMEQLAADILAGTVSGLIIATTYRIRKEKIVSERTLQNLRDGKPVSTVLKLLGW